MKILQVTEFYPPLLGGLEIHVASLAAELAKRGHDVHVATLGLIPTEERVDGVTVHRFVSGATRMAGSYLHLDSARPFHPPVPDPWIQHALHKLIHRINPDVIHAHNWMAASVPRNGPPLVFTAHDYAWACPKRTLLRRDRSNCDGPGPLRCAPCSTPQYGLSRAVAIDITTKIGRRLVSPKAFIAVSSAVARELQPYTDVSIEVIRNFIPSDLTNADTEEEGYMGLPSTFFVLFAGSVSVHKGIDVLLSAWERDPPCELVIAALSLPERSWPDRVHVVSLDRGQMVNAWKSASIAVVPSIWGDPCPTVALEALHYGVPIVGSAIGGLIDIVVDGVGVLVPPGEPSALREAIVRLMFDDKRRSAMGIAARNRASYYSIEKVTAEIEDVYHRVIWQNDASG